jgi:hypothetical protein
MVTHERLGLTRCKLRDIGVDGAFVETEGFALSRGATVDLVLKVRSGEKTRHHRVEARVTRVSESGAALVFDKLDDSLYRTLLDIVYGK